MATNPILGLDVYIALAAVGWADGELTRQAADAILRTAVEEGLDIESLQRLEEAVKSPVDVGVVDRMNMSKSDRLFVYAVASWIATLDGEASVRTREALTQLATALGVPEPPRQRADEILREIAGEDNRPDRFDVRTLRETLDARLDAARAARLGQAVDP
ncbi:MAG: TerB family tellurite resistance protein [Myxococcales bacterium]|nr:TerB family tellurite resistance protein [Myxococcales bacterium]